jgi:hypothetical protein
MIHGPTTRWLPFAALAISLGAGCSARPATAAADATNVRSLLDAATLRPVRFGMTPAELRSARPGAKAPAPAANGKTEASIEEPSGTPFRQVLYVFENGTLHRIIGRLRARPSRDALRTAALDKWGKPISEKESAMRWTARWTTTSENIEVEREAPSGNVEIAFERLVPGATGGVKKPLRAYLATARRAKVFAHRVETETLDERKTQAYLRELDLDQVADGPLVRCPSNREIRFEDASGKPLGTIGICDYPWAGAKEVAARFDAPDGTFGGIRLK